MHVTALIVAIIVSSQAPATTMLDWQTVALMARLQSPSVRVAGALHAEAEALREHADAPAGGNPELALTAGPGYVNPGPPALEFMLLLTWPFDLSGSGSIRRRWADRHALEMDQDAQDAARLAVADALDLFVRALGAHGRIATARARTTLDQEFVRIARVRRAAGEVGDGEAALAYVMAAEGEALLQTAIAEHDALLARLAASLGLDDAAPVTLLDSAPPAVPPLQQLLGQLDQRPDLQRCRAAVAAAEVDRTLQRRLGWSIPRVTVGGGRGPEYQGELGLTVPLPVYQRNQANAALAAAHVTTADLQRSLAARLAASDLRAAYARFAGAQAALERLQQMQQEMNDAEHLAVRAFDLGQETLARAVMIRREVLNARSALQDAKVSADRARVAVMAASGG